jgi:hypothetical protein
VIHGLVNQPEGGVDECAGRVGPPETHVRRRPGYSAASALAMMVLMAVGIVDQSVIWRQLIAAGIV